MTSVERMWKTIERAKKEYMQKRDNYGMTANEMCALMERSAADQFEGLSATFNLGFIRGVRWAEKQRKKEREVMKV